MKAQHLLILFLLLAPFYGMGQSVLELEASQSMSIAGKGPGQDAAINPYAAGNSIGIVENIGKHPFTIRIQKEGQVLETISIDSKEVKEVKLLKGYEMYFDATTKARAKVDFKELRDTN